MIGDRARFTERQLGACGFAGEEAKLLDLGVAEQGVGGLVLQSIDHLSSLPEIVSVE